MSLPAFDPVWAGGTAAFAAAIFLLDVYDVSLPQSRNIGVAGALVAAAMSAVGAPTAFLLGVLSAAVVHVTRRLRAGEERPWSELWVRLAATLAGVGAMSLIPGHTIALDYARIILVPTAFSGTELAVRQLAVSLASGKPLADLVSGNVSRQALLFAAEISVSALTVILYRELWVWSVATVLVLLLLIRQSYAMLLEVHETYHTSVAMLVEVAEADDPALAGHSERVAEIARSIAAYCNIRGDDLERIEYAALLHDVHSIAGSASEELEHKSTAAEVVGNVDFLSGVVPILDLIEGQPQQSASERQLLSGFIVALASDIDRAQRPDLEEVHPEARSAGRLSGRVPNAIRARAIAGAVAGGYPVPAVD